MRKNFSLPRDLNPQPSELQQFAWVLPSLQGFPSLNNFARTLVDLGQVTKTTSVPNSCTSNRIGVQWLYLKLLATRTTSGLYYKLYDVIFTPS